MKTSFKKLLSLLLVFCMVLSMMPTTVFAAAVPSGAPFTELKTDVEGTVTITDKGTVDFGNYTDVSYYHVELPEGATEVYVTYSADTNFYLYNDATYAYKVSVPDLEQGYAPGSYPVVTNDDGTKTATIPVANFMLEDGVGHGIALEKPNFQPVNLFTFSYAEGEAEHTHSYEAAVTAPTCTAGGYTTYTCTCGDTYTADETAATGHSYESGVCTVCGEADPDYAAGDEKPFLSIAIDGKELDDESIVSKGPFDLGSLESSYSYVHEDVPYYHVTVPCGTESVDVTYSEDTNIFDYGSDVYGYATELTVDAVSSATVKSRTLSDAYTQNEDGTQTVKTPVTGYTFDEDGNGMAITLEEDGGSYEAICLFTFEYDGKDHVYTSEVTTEATCTEAGVMTYTCTCGDTKTEEIAATGHSFTDGTCSVCGETDPDYSVEVAIPDGAPFTAISSDVEGTVTITDKGAVDFGSYTGVSYYHVELPEGATEVYVIYSADTTFYLYNDAAYAYRVSVPEYEMGYASGSFATVGNDDGTRTVTIPVEKFLLTDGAGYGIALEDTGWKPVNLFTFELSGDSNAEHTHSYEAVVTAPTCTEGGYTTYTCSCGDSYTADETPATGHSHEAVVTAPTCTEGGYTTYTCSCGDSYTADETAAAGHSYESGICTACGEADPDYQDPNAPEQDANGVYQLATAEDLLWFAETVNGGETSISAVLTADIDLSEIVTWTGIGTSSAKFAGSFDGQNHTVTFDGANNALFAYTYGSTSAYAQIKNVVVDGSINGAGGIVATANYTNIENCVNRADVTGANNTGGIVGNAPMILWNNIAGYVTITNCVNEGSVSGGSNVGGILGACPGAAILTGCCNSGSISGTTYVGGIAGNLQGSKSASSVTNCYNLGAVSGTGTAAGLVGYMLNGASIVNSYNAGTASYAVAGDIYDNRASVSNTYYLDAASTEAVPAEDLFDTIAVTSKTHEEMRADDFVTTLGDAYQANCPYPVLTWQTAAAHDYQKGVCSVCAAEDPNYVPDADEPAQVDGVYQIGTAAELNWFAAHVNEGNTTASAVLTADIDLDNASWTSIGVKDYRFAGSFDGQGHKVTNLVGANGLFGYAKGAEDAYAVIKNVTVDGTITATGKYVAGIVGDTKYVTVENCVNLADISSTYEYASGVIGYAANTTITGCGNEGAISGAAHTAGIVGYNSNASVTTNCWNLGDVSASGSYVGGIAGRNVNDGSSVTNCYNKGTVSGKNNVGGIIGYNQKYMANCYNWGAVIGQKYVGGISGYNTGSSSSYVGMENCYNAGFVSGNEQVGGAAGFQSTGLISNSYYLEGTAAGGTSAYVDGAYVPVDIDGVTAATADTMKSAEFAATMGDSFKQGGLYPILSWQDDDAASSYAVTIPEGDGYTVMGPEVAIAGEDYRFSVTITEGYMEGENFAVQVNGETVTAVNGVCTVENVNVALNIVVNGVELEPAAIFTVTHPETGNGYAVKSVDGYDASSVAAKTDYKFTVEFANGFKAGENFTVKANDVELTADENGVYTIEAVTENQTITVSGVEMIPYEDTVSVNLTVNYGENQFYVPENFSEFMMLEDLEIPYFDIGLYDLEGYYYNPDCYAGGRQTAGNPETAYGVVTLIHTFIYVTEVYYLDYDAADAGKGLSHQNDNDNDGVSDFAEVLSWTGGVGSSFMDLWDHGTNLNYYINYEYPLGSPAWGSTSDQIALEDGDVVSVHLIEDKQVSGSNFSFFTVNDEDNTFTQDDTTDSITVKQGETVDLTLYWTGQGSNYTTVYDAIPNYTLYWSSADDVSNDVSLWDKLGTTNATGDFTVDTAELEPGTYYIGSLGGLTAGGTDNGDGFISRGGETGPGVFKLIVEESDEPAGLLGDANSDGIIDSFDATLILRYDAGVITADGLNLSVCDVSGDGVVDSFDATLILRYDAGVISKFPAET